MPLQPARPGLSPEGIPYSEAYQDVYHSADGGLEQARHVFLAGNGLPARWRGRDQFVVVETGFGMGLNFLATWQAWRDDPARSARLHFVSVEKHPFEQLDLSQSHDRLLPPDVLALGRRLVERWPLLTAGMHRIAFDADRVHLTLLLGDAATLLPQLEARADALFLDGFSPAKNADMWQAPLFSALARRCMPEATLATWSVAAGVREALTQAGFVTEKRPGFGRKRDMLVGHLHPSLANKARHMLGKRPSAPRRVIVIGAGLAGCAVAERLAARGVALTLIERHPAPACEASGNLAGVLRPNLMAGETQAARFSRAAFLHASAHLRRLAAEGSALRWGPTGVIQIARDAAHFAELQSLLERSAWPHSYARLLPDWALSQRLGWPAEQGGCWYPRGAWVNPPSLCTALLDRAGGRVVRAFSREALRLIPHATGWRVEDARGNCFEAEAVVIANAADALRLSPCEDLPLMRVRGQTTLLPRDVAPGLDITVCREGYIAPGPDGRLCLGASFDFDDTNTAPDARAHLANLARLDSLLPGAARGLDVAALEGRVAFRTATPDRLPLVGALRDTDRPVATSLPLMPRLPGLYALLGLGARGMVWSVLAAELLASQMLHEPLPVERDVAQALDPARFAMRALRHAGKT